MWPIAYRLLQAYQFLGSIGATGTIALTRANAAQWGLFEETVKLIQDWSFLLIVVLTISVAVSKGLCDYFGPPWVWNAIRRILTRFREQAFRDIDGDPVHHHRVTLFQRKRWFWGVWPWPWGTTSWWKSIFWPWGMGFGPRSGWMVAVARSGQTTQKTNAVFLAPDDADASEGVPGLVWQSDDTLTIDLPDVTSEAAPEEIEEYAHQACVSAKWIRRRLKDKKPLPLSLCGIPVEVNHAF